MMPAIRPDLVQPFESLEPRDTAYGFEPAYRGWITQQRRPDGADTAGHLGDRVSVRWLYPVMVVLWSRSGASPGSDSMSWRRSSGDR